MFQKTIVVGHLGGDPDLRYTPDGKAVCSFNVATSRSWMGANGDRQEKTTWYRVTTWDKLAELCKQYLAKGRLVLVEGDVEASAWLDKNTNEARAKLELTARNVRFLGGSQGTGAMEHDMGEAMPAPAPAPAQAQAAAAPAPVATAAPARTNSARSAGNGAGGRRNAPPPPDNFGDDDIPF